MCKLLLAAVAVWLVAYPARASPPSEAEIRQAMAFVHQVTGLPVRRVPPVALRPIDALQRMAGWAAVRGARVVGFYDGRTVFLLDAWNGARLDDGSLLVHEIAHAMGAGECVAYRTQGAWLRQRGSSLEAIGVTDGLLREATRC